MSETTRRGFILFGILVVLGAFLCYILPFVWMPQWRIGVGLPPISLPAEVLAGNWPAQGFDFTNSFSSLIVVDLLVLLMGVVVNRAVSAQGIDRFVPRGFSHIMELIVEFWYNQARSVLGNFTSRVIPLALTVFCFVLVANWIKLVPGVETVGIATCAEPGKAGYPLDTNGVTLKVDSQNLKDRAGTKVTEADFLACAKAHPDRIPPAITAKCDRNDANMTDEEKEICKIRNESSGGASKESGSTGTGTDKLASFTTTSGSGGTNAAESGNPDLFNVIPYFRALATDLNVPLAMAIIVFIAVQIWGVQALGAPYFYKFINIPALGNLAKNPMGVMDFVVGLVDIISELSRLISLSFRLLGNMFAGGILLAVMTFLVAGMVPIAFYGLEIFAGVIQAYVFAILTVMYASQAVTSHHAEDHESHVEHEAHEEAKPVEQVVDLP